VELRSRDCHERVHQSNADLHPPRVSRKARSQDLQGVIRSRSRELWHIRVAEHHTIEYDDIGRADSGGGFREAHHMALHPFLDRLP
jgi:hypothetical protein